MAQTTKLVATLVASSLAAHTVLTPTSAVAQNGAAIAAGIGGLMLGMIAGGAMAQQRQGQRGYVMARPRPRPKPRVLVSSANVAVQNALISFGFYVGPINGRMDGATKNAIRTMQAKLGDQPTGVLTQPQRRALLTAYAQRGQGQMATGPMQNPDSIFAVIAGGAAGAASVAGGTALSAGGSASVASATTILPDVTPPMETARAPDAWRLQCQAQRLRPEPVAFGELRGPAQGGLVPGQFCAARLAAMVSAKDAFAKMTGVEPAQIRRECGRIADSLAPLRTSLVIDLPAAMVKKAAKEFAAIAADQREGAAVNFQICLGYGFADNAPEIVLSSSLALIGIGEAAYAEIVGGAFALGAGVEPNQARAASWLDQAAEAIDKGAAPVIKDRGVERAEILRLTSAELKAGGQPKLQAGIGPRDVERGVVPSFATVAAPASSKMMTVMQPVTAPTSLVAAKPDSVVAPAISLMDARAEPAPASADSRKAAAEAFFVAEQAEHKTRLVGLGSALGLSEDAIPPLCAVQEATIQSPRPEAQLPLRLCRSYAYSKGDRAMMFRFDRALSDLGDQDAEGRMGRHLILGNDRRS